MSARLVMCSAASFVLIFVVMAESFTNATACALSVSEFWAVAVTALPSKVAKIAQLIARYVLMGLSSLLLGLHYPARFSHVLFAAVRPEEKGTIVASHRPDPCRKKGNHNHQLYRASQHERQRRRAFGTYTLRLRVRVLAHRRSGLRGTLSPSFLSCVLGQAVRAGMPVIYRCGETRTGSTARRQEIVTGRGIA